MLRDGVAACAASARQSLSAKQSEAQLHLVEGEAGPTIPHLAGKERIDLVIMSTVARASMEGYFIGNTAETVLHRVACSVLTVKPNRTYDSHLCTER